MSHTVNSVDTPKYIPESIADGDEVIELAINILANRLRKPGKAMTSPTTVKQYCILTATHDHRERFRVLFLDNQHCLITDECVSEGTINQASVYPREIVRRSIELGAASLILTHNHPSGSLEASRSDIALTKHLKEALGLIDVRVLDHVITAGDEAVSLAETGQM